VSMCSGVCVCVCVGSWRHYRLYDRRDRTAGYRPVCIVRTDGSGNRNYFPMYYCVVRNFALKPLTDTSATYGRWLN
jgi:hypothetical protein